MRKLTLILSAAGFALLAPVAAHAAEGGQSPYLKGYTDAMSGVLPPYPGLYLRNDTVYYSGETEASVLGGRIVAEAKVESVANASAFTYVTDKHFLGGQYAFALAVPFATADISASVTGPLGGTFGVRDDTAGTGDLIVVPVILGWHNGKVHTNASVSFYIPAGEYTEGDLANLSKNYATLQLQGAATWMDPDSGWAFSGTLTYVTNSENQATDYQTGDIVHFDGAATKAFGKWRVGGVAYAMYQIEGDSGSGARLGEHKSEVYGIGPFVGYDAKFGERPVTFLLKWYHEFGATNTFEGDTVTAAFAFKF